MVLDNDLPGIYNMITRTAISDTVIIPSAPRLVENDYSALGLYNMVTRTQPQDNDNDKIILGEGITLSSPNGYLSQEEFLILSRNKINYIIYNNYIFALTKKTDNILVYTTEDGDGETLDQITIDVNTKEYNYSHILNNSFDKNNYNLAIKQNNSNISLLLLQDNKDTISDISLQSEYGLTINSNNNGVLLNISIAESSLNASTSPEETNAGKIAVLTSITSLNGTLTAKKQTVLHKVAQSGLIEDLDQQKLFFLNGGTSVINIFE